MSARRAVPCLALAIAAGGCGATRAHPAAPSADAAIRAVVLRSYHPRGVGDCERVFTPSFILLGFDGLAACRKHVAAMAKLPPRTVSIISVRRHGPVADARIRVDSFDETVKLVRSDGRWLVDDSVGTDGSAKQSLSQSRAQAVARAHAHTPLPLGTTASFKPIAGVGPDARFTVAVTRVVSHGRARRGQRSFRAPVTNDFGAVTNRRARYRVVNVRIVLTNLGPKRWRGTFAGSLIARGRPWPALPHAGRAPDWTDGLSRGVAPGHRVTRWMTFGLPARARIGAVEVQPELLSGSNTVSAVEPDRARWLP
jgi:hypothetical protein